MFFEIPFCVVNFEARDNTKWFSTFFTPIRCSFRFEKMARDIATNKTAPGRPFSFFTLSFRDCIWEMPLTQTCLIIFTCMVFSNFFTQYWWQGNLVIYQTFSQEVLHNSKYTLLLKLLLKLVHTFLGHWNCWQTPSLHITLIIKIPTVPKKLYVNRKPEFCPTFW